MTDAWIAIARRCAPVIWLVLATAAIVVLIRRLQHFTPDQLLTAFRAVSPSTIAIALTLCLSAFIILSAYEYVAVRYATGRRLLCNAAITSWIAHSLGHVIGAALLSGGALRYRRYASAGLSIGEVSSITLLSAMPYVLAAGWLLDFTLVIFTEQASHALHLPAALLAWAGWLGLIKDVAWVALVCTRRSIQVLHWHVKLPSFGMTCLQIIVGATEIVLVAAILYVFMPHSLAMNLIAFTGIFLIAATVAQISHVPAGLGVLEAALLILLPQIPVANLLAAILCYRVVFELFPFLVGAALLVQAELSKGSARAHANLIRSKIELRS